MPRKNVLILSAGRRVELVQAFQKELAALCPDAKVFATDLKPHLSSACQVAAHSFAAPRATDASFPAYLETLCADHDIGLVVPTIDTELLVIAAHRGKFAAFGTSIVISDVALIQQCRDKRKTGALFASLDIDTPAIFAPDALVFPCFGKPYDGSSSIGAMRVDTPEDAAILLASNDRTMFMELVDQSYREFTVDAYFDQAGVMKAMVPRERLETRAGEVSKGVTRRGLVYDWLLSRLPRLPGARGCITLQLFVDTASARFRAIEINPRFGGGFPLSYAAGANFPLWLIEEYLLNRQAPSMDTWEANLMMLRYDAKILVSGHHDAG
jgi:carbamoyl-phosphate synthase large subunit